ncbi:hypothetical protein BLOT_009299 [Blomia tropicalis]|nr:hypothetical protein BLOT_009299 [Blomia tropicalis]
MHKHEFSITVSLNVQWVPFHKLEEYRFGTSFHHFSQMCPELIYSSSIKQDKINWRSSCV